MQTAPVCNPASSKDRLVVHDLTSTNVRPAGTGVVTPETLVFNQTIPRRQAVARPVEIIWTTGDGVVDLNSLRLCKRYVRVHVGL